MIEKIQGLLIQNRMQFLVTTVYCAFEFALKHFVEGGQGGGRPGEKGAGGVWGVGSRIPKVVGEVDCMPIQNLFVVHISVVCCVNIILLIYRSIEKNQITDGQP